MPWKDGNHHWVPRQGQWAKQNRDLWDEAYDPFTEYLSGEEHQRVHRDEREVGPIGSIARYDLRLWKGDVMEPD